MNKLKTAIILSLAYITSAFVNTLSTLPSTNFMSRKNLSMLRMCDFNASEAFQKVKGFTTRRELLQTGSATSALLAFDSIFSKAYAQETDHSWTVHNGVFNDEFIRDFEKTNSGLLFKDIEVGKGAYPNDGDAATIQMVGYIYESGEKWCNTYKGIPAYQSVVRAGARENQKFMKGLNEGVKTMKCGGRRILVIPAYLAYNYVAIYSQNDPNVMIIPAGAALVCYIELNSFAPI